ncbi:type I-F CRISPR-associated protein Csy2 [Vibrio crassostreae]|uniref:type I-F CRISPR-associated protein Csy2 n=1 Tax=Vibrio crassostreae TaxID=246167 RepID=UPI001B315A6A|nr:type I-F CRISPR-associated protein Csy2 [Vibrio crassostreae]
MTKYLLLKNIYIEGATAFSGITYGAISMPAYAGFVHNLARHVSAKTDAKLGSFTVFTHSCTPQVTKRDGESEKRFKLTSNPPTGNKPTPPSFNEAGRLFARVSVLIELTGVDKGNREQEEALRKVADRFMGRARIAGGTVFSVEDIFIPDGSDNEIASSLMPASVLVENREYLIEHLDEMRASNANATTLDALIDIYAVHLEAENAGNNSYKWTAVKNKGRGYLVPIVTGYKAISDIYSCGELEGSKDPSTDSVFVEYVHTLGQWIRANHIESLDDVMWRTDAKDGWYLVTNEAKTDNEFEDIELDKEIKF